MTQIIRIVLAYLCLVLFIGAAISWTRSYYAKSNAKGSLTLIQRFSIVSWHGQVQWRWYVDERGRPGLKWDWNTSCDQFANTPIGRHPAMRHLPQQLEAPGLLNISGRFDRFEWSGNNPHWFFLIGFAILAYLLKPKPKLRFGIRDILILTTIVAIFLAGLIPWMRLADRPPVHFNPRMINVA